MTGFRFLLDSEAVYVGSNRRIPQCMLDFFHLLIQTQDSPLDILRRNVRPDLCQ